MAELRFITRAPITDDNPVMRGMEQAEERRYKKSTRESAAKKAEQDYLRAKQQYDFAAEDHPVELRTKTTAADKGTFDLGEDVAMAPDKRRQTTAQADAAVTTASKGAFDLGEDIATAPDKRVQIANQARGSGYTADKQGSDARVAGASELSNINKAKFESQRAGADASRSSADAKVAQGTVMSRINQAGSQAAGAETDAAKKAYDFNDEQRNAHFLKSLEILKNQGYDAAAQYAQANNIPLPPTFLRDQRMRAGIAEIEARAKSVYGNQPRAYAQAVATGIASLKAHADELGYNPAEEVYTNPAMPEPSENAYGLLRPSSGPSPASSAQVSVDDRRLLTTLETANRHANPANPFAPPTLDTQAVARVLMQQRRHDLARLYDPSIPALPNSPMAPQQPTRGGVNFVQPPARPAPQAPAAPMSQAAPVQTPPFVPPSPQTPTGVPGGTPPYVPQPQAQAAPPQRPQALASVPRLQWSAQRQQWRDAATGAVFDAQGNRVQ